MKFGTKAIHAGVEPDPSTGAIMTPIYQTSTYVQAAPGDHKGYQYARTKNPTRTALEKSLAALENGKHGICFASGLAAMDAVMKLLKPGDEILSTNDLYGGSYRLITKIYEPYGLKGKFVNMQDASAIEKQITKNTKLIWVETPTNPMLSIVDIKKICQIAKKKKVMVCVDNTFASPYLQNPLDFRPVEMLSALLNFSASTPKSVRSIILVLKIIPTMMWHLHRCVTTGRWFLLILKKMISKRLLKSLKIPRFSLSPNLSVASNHSLDTQLQ